jgi:hypothetical protein
MEKPDSCVTFKLISGLTGDEYRKYVGELLFNYLSQIDSQLDQRYAIEIAYHGRWNEESGMGMFRINEEYIDHLKLYLYDEDETTHYYGYARNIVFRDHYSEWDVKKVYLVADTFEAFLKSRGAEYTRHNRMR